VLVVLVVLEVHFPNSQRLASGGLPYPLRT